MLETVTNLRGDRIIVVVTLLSFVVCPSCAFLYTFDHDAFTALDFGKVTMLSLAIAAPVFLLNLIPAVVYARLGTSKPQPETLISQIATDRPDYGDIVKRLELQGRRDYREQMDLALALASIVSVVPLYAPIALNIAWPLSFRGALLCTACVEVIAFGGAVALGLWGLLRPRRG